MFENTSSEGRANGKELGLKRDIAIPSAIAFVRRFNKRIAFPIARPIGDFPTLAAQPDLLVTTFE